MPQTNRRQFLQTSAVAGIGFWVAGGVAPRESRAANEQLAMASVGIGGKGSSEEGTSSLYPSSLELERNQVAGQASRNDSLAGVR